MCLLGATLFTIKKLIPHGYYQWFIDERLPFGPRTERRIIEQGNRYLSEKFVREEVIDLEAAADERAKRVIRWPVPLLRCSWLSYVFTTRAMRWIGSSVRGIANRPTPELVTALKIDSPQPKGLIYPFFGNQPSLWRRLVNKLITPNEEPGSR